jgi:hypothetical protein
MPSDVSDFDVTGADISFDSLNLNPSTGINPGRVVRAIPTAAQEVYPETTSAILAPVSTTVMPGGAENKPIAAAPGQPVDLSPTNPANIRLAQTAAPVIPSGSVAPAVQAPRAAPVPGAVRPGQGQGPFGSNIVITPKYDPNANPIQVERDTAKAQADRLMQRANDPDWQFWHESKAKADRDEANRLYGVAAQRDQQIQTQATNQQLAQNMGLRTPMAATADQAAVIEQGMTEWRQGNYKAYLGLHGAGQGARADMYKEEGMNNLGKDVAEGLKQYNRLDAAANENDYKKVRGEVLDEAKKNRSARDFGLHEGNIPKTKAEYEARDTLIKAPISSASKLVSTYKRQLDSQGIPQPIADEKVAGGVTKQFAHQSGDAISGTQAVTMPDMGGAQGAMVTQENSKDLSLFGPGPTTPGGPRRWNTMDAGLRKEIKEAYASEEEKGIIQKYKMSFDFWETVHHPEMFNAPAGISLVKDMVGAIGRDVAEGSKAAGSIGLSKMLDASYGGVEKFLNDATNNWAAYKAWVASGKKGPEVKLNLNPRMTPQSIQGLQMIADFKKQQALDQAYRLDGPTRQLGLHGGELNSVGLPQELQDAVRPLHEAAVQEGRLDYESKPHVVRGTQRIMLQPGTKGEGIVPAGAYKASLDAVKNPDAAIPSTAIPTGGGPVVPGGPPSTPGGGGGTVVAPPPTGGGPVIPGGGPPVVSPGGGRPSPRCISYCTGWRRWCSSSFIRGNLLLRPSIIQLTRLRQIYLVATQLSELT